MFAKLLRWSPVVMLPRQFVNNFLPRFLIEVWNSSDLFITGVRYCAQRSLQGEIHLINLQKSKLHLFSSRFKFSLIWRVDYLVRPPECPQTWVCHLSLGAVRDSGEGGLSANLSGRLLVPSLSALENWTDLNRSELNWTEPNWAICWNKHWLYLIWQYYLL